jgi:adenosylcobinamide-GDP ribazoletransferase
MLAELLRAFQYLTVLPLPQSAESASLGRASLFFPAVGLVLGGIVVGADRLAESLPRGVVDPAIVALLIALTGARPQRAVATTATGVLRPRQAIEVLQQNEAAPWSGAAWLAAAALIGFKVGAVAALGANRLWALLFSPMIGRWAMVVCAFSSRTPARTGAERDYIRGVQFRDFAWTSVFTCAILFGYTEAAGILVIALVAPLIVGLRLLWHRWLGGVTSPVVTATGELAEVFALVLFAGL